MDIEKTLQVLAETRYPALTEKEHQGLTDYFTALFQHHAAGVLKEREAVESVMSILVALDNGDMSLVRNTLNLDNWPSKTGNPSGRGRSNAPIRAR